MTISEFEKAFQQGKDYYGKNVKLHTVISDIIDAFYGEVEQEGYGADFRGCEWAVVKLDDGKVQLDSKIAACPGAYSYSIFISHIYR